MDGIGRLRIVCLADRRSARAAFAVRARLEQVARSDLGRAIDRHVGGDRSIQLDRLTVRLELDPNDYDDPTLALLWASRIRDALVAVDTPALAAQARGLREDPEPAVASTDWPMAGSDARLSGDAVTASARRAIAGDEAAATDLARAVLADPARIARLLRSELSVGERSALVSALEGSTAGHRRRTPGSVGGLGGSVGRRPAAIPSRAVARRQALVRSWTATLVAAGRRRLARIDPPAARNAPLPVRGRSSTATIRPTPAAPNPWLVSKAGGLAFLWPWLTAHLEAARIRLPRLDPRHARRLAVAALVPDVAQGVDDAVVRLLAGDDIGDEPSMIVVTDGELRLAADDAEDVLDAFAAAIPGFAGSTAAFVRREFLVRPGVVDPRPDPVSVRLAPMPLDPAVGRLPYPIAAFRLPWTRPIAIHLGGG